MVRFAAAGVFTDKRGQIVRGCCKLFHPLDFPSHLPLWTQLDIGTPTVSCIYLFSSQILLLFIWVLLAHVFLFFFEVTAFEEGVQLCTGSFSSLLICRLPHGGGHGERRFGSPV